MSRRTLGRLTPALLVVGLALLVPFKATVTLALGVACLLAFVACGVFLIAEPGFLADDRDPDQRPPA